MLYIIDSKNKLNFEALMNALGKSSEQKINIQRITAEGMPDSRPTTISSTTQAAIDGVNALVRSFLKEDDRSNNPAIAICLQKGVDLEYSVLTCVIAIRKTDTYEVSTTTCTQVPISSEVKKFVQEKELALYEAYRAVYGDAVADKQVSLYEKVCPGCLEVDWLAEGISLALR